MTKRERSLRDALVEAYRIIRDCQVGEVLLPGHQKGLHQVESCLLECGFSLDKIPNMADDQEEV